MLLASDTYGRNGRMVVLGRGLKAKEKLRKYIEQHNNEDAYTYAVHVKDLNKELFQ